MEIFQYDFMKKAFLVALVLSFIVPSIGFVLVLRRRSMLPDSLSHVSLAGVVLGILFGMSPTVGALIACIIAVLMIELLSERMPKYSEITIAILSSVGVGLAGVLAGKVSGNTNFENYLFGSIIVIADNEIGIIMVLALFVFLLFLLLYRELFLITFDKNRARMLGISVKWVNILFNIITAVTVSIASRAIGALVVSSLMILPVACSMELERSYQWTTVFSIGFGALFSVVGLFLSYYLDIKPGGSIALTGAICLCFIIIIKTIKIGYCGRRYHYGSETRDD